MPASKISNAPVVVIAILSLAINPKLETAGVFKVTLFVPSYSLPFAVIPEIVIDFVLITKFLLVITGVL